MIYYSPSINGFFLENSPHRPEDCVAITEEQHQLLLRGQKADKVIAADEKGNPTLVDAPKPSDELLASNARVYRNKLLSESDWVVNSDVSMPKDKKDAWKAYRQALRDITKQAGFPEGVVFPEKPV